MNRWLQFIGNEVVQQHYQLSIVDPAKFHVQLRSCDRNLNAVYPLRGFQLLTRHTIRFHYLTHTTTRVSRYQTGKTNLDFTEARDSEWQ